MTESRAADLHAIDWPLAGRRYQGKTLYRENIGELERLIADLYSILDVRDRYTHLAGCLLNPVLDELTLAMLAGTLTPEAALALTQQAGQAGDSIALVEGLIVTIDAIDNALPTA